VERRGALVDAVENGQTAEIVQHPAAQKAS
jgi:hypothetical protein